MIKPIFSLFKLNKKRVIWLLFIVCILYLPIFGIMGRENSINQEDVKIIVHRLQNNPIIKPRMLPGDEGANINGPSLIRVPDWVPNPLGRYYLYFAHHIGKYIRVAYANNLEGPWKIYKPGVLRIEGTIFNSREKGAHIASPDVHIDCEKREIRMYFHGTCPLESDCPPYGQGSSYAVSKDGINFCASKELLKDIYFRVFKWKNEYYAFTRQGILYKSRDKNGLKNWCRPIQNPAFPGIGEGAVIRHLAVKITQRYLYVFYSCIGHSPERILVSIIRLSDNWITNWNLSNPIEVMRTEKEYEGLKFPIRPSKSGSAREPVHEVRDPYIYSEDSQDYLLYSIAGESGIAIAKLTIAPHKNIKNHKVK